MHRSRHIQELASAAWFEFRAARDASVKSPMMDAIEQNNLEQVRACLNDDAFNVNDIIFTGLLGQFTALMGASYRGRVQIVEELLRAKGIDVNLTGGGSIQYTPLMWACVRGHYDVVQALLRVPEIDVDYCTDATALQIAVQYDDRVNIVRALLCAGANADAVVPHTTDMTALKLSIHPPVRELLESWNALPVEKRADWCKSHLSDDQYRNAKAYGCEHRNLGAWTPNTHNTFPESFRNQTAVASMAVPHLPRDMRYLLTMAMDERNKEKISPSPVDRSL